MVALHEAFLVHSLIAIAMVFQVPDADFPLLSLHAFMALALVF